MVLKIEKAVLADLQAILQLQKECYVTEAQLHDEFDIPPLKQDLQSIENELNTNIILKGVCEGKIVASVRAFSESVTCFIGRLIVDKDYQNNGFGRQMMNAIENEFSDCNRFELFTGYKSEKNLYLYNKLGYREFNRKVISDKLTFVYLEKLR